MRKLALMLSVAALLTGCQTAPPVEIAPPDPLRLIASSPLVWPDGCEASGSFVVQFVVTESGRAESIQPPPGDICMQTALAAWVASFRYAPQSKEVPASIEWLMVTGSKGG